MHDHKSRCGIYREWRRSINVTNGIRGYASIVERGEVDSWKRKIAKSVSDTVMSDPKERARRRELSKTTITEWAQSDEGRRIASETAIRTSSRADVIENRTRQLERWRDTHPEEFAKTTMKMICSRTSRPENALFKECKRIDEGFRHNQPLWNKKFTTASKRRQIDVVHKDMKIVVEFDGPTHFECIYKGMDLEKVKARDAEVNGALVTAGYTVIRITYEDYDDRSGRGFSDRVLQTIQDAVAGKIRGLHRIGAAYAQD
jgi:very-short-patch-repair endonuclease